MVDDAIRMDIDRGASMGRLSRRIPAGLRARIRQVHASIYELAGSDRHSRPSLHGIEDRLDTLLDHPGFFVEAGAFNGFDQSNTYWLERFRGWRGLLVEPLPREAKRARDVRRRETVVSSCALGPPELDGQTVTIRYAGLMSITSRAMDDSQAAKHIDAGVEVQGLSGTFEVEVLCRTLTGVLEAAGAPRHIGLLSLDVEGFEVSVLRGLDVSRFRPQFVMVESKHSPDLDGQLRSMGFSCADPDFTPNDVLYRMDD